MKLPEQAVGLVKILAKALAPVVRKYVDASAKSMRESISSEMQSAVQEMSVKNMQQAMEAIALLRQQVSDVQKASAAELAEVEKRFQAMRDQLQSDLQQSAAADIERRIDLVLQSIPVPQDGKSVTVDDVRPLLEQLVAEIPRPLDGKSVTVEDVRPVLQELVGQIPRPQDGKSVSVEDVRPLLEQMVAEIPRPQDGKSVTAEDVRPLLQEMVAQIPRAKDGDPGRDAAQIEVLPAIDIERSYPRGTYAKHLGGLWRSFETTSAMRGWECIVEGLAQVEFELADARELKIKMLTSSGRGAEKSYYLPIPKYHGIHKQGAAYRRGDMVTRDGSVWYATQETDEFPGAGFTWILAVKRGQDRTQSVKTK